MTSRPAGAPSYDDLAARLADAEAALAAVAAGAVDALASGHGAGAEIITLERADSFFVTLVTQMQEATASLDSNGTLLYANPRFAELLGLPLSQVLGRTLAELTAKAGRAAAQQLLAEAASGPARGTLELLRGDGRLVPVSVSAAPITSERPEVCLVATDLTERIQAETTLRDAEEIMQQAQAHSLIMHQLTFKIARAIRQTPDPQEALDVLCAALGEGLGVDRVIANTVEADREVMISAQWHLPGLSPRIMSDDLLQHAGRIAGKLWLSEGFLARDDFLAPWVQSHGPARIFHREVGTRAVIMVPIGLGDRVVGVIYVITVHEPRTWTESEISAVQQVAGFVARVILEADHRAHQSEYIDRLERLDRQKTDFLSTVSHELRTPLTSISGYLELLQDGDAGELAEEQHRMLEVVGRNTRRLRGLIDNLLELNQIESGGHKDAARVSMPELITHAGQELSPLAHAVAVELDIDTGPEVAIVQGNPTQGPIAPSVRADVREYCELPEAGCRAAMRRVREGGRPAARQPDRAVGVLAGAQVLRRNPPAAAVAGRFNRRASAVSHRGVRRAAPSASHWW